MTSAKQGYNEERITAQDKTARQARDGMDDHQRARTAQFRFSLEVSLLKRVLYGTVTDQTRGTVRVSYLSAINCKNVLTAHNGRLGILYINTLSVTVLERMADATHLLRPRWPQPRLTAHSIIAILYIIVTVFVSQLRHATTHRYTSPQAQLGRAIHIDI